MGVRAWTWLVVAVSFAGYLAVLVRVRTRSAGAFYRPTARVFPPAAGAAAAAGWLSAASYLSVGGALAVSAWGGAIYLLGWTAGLALLALLVAPYLRRSGRNSLPLLLAERFRSPATGAAATACALLVAFTYLTAQLRGVAIVVARYAPMPLPWAMAATAGIVLAYTALGRLRTLTGGQVAQYVALAGAFSLLAGALLARLTGSALPQEALWSRLTAEGAAAVGAAPGQPLLTAVARPVPALGPAPWAGSAGMADALATVLALVAGTAALPHMVGRFLAMPRARDARRSAGWGLLFVVLFYSAVPAVALAARAGLLASPGGAWRVEWAVTGTLGPRLDPDVLVLAAPEMLGLPPWVIAVAAAGALAAGVSAAGALVLSLGAGVGRDLLREHLARALSDRTEVWISRSAAGVSTLAAAWLALRPPGTVVQTVGLAFGLAAAAFFPALVAAVLWRRASRLGIFWGMIAGASFTVGYVHWFRFLRPDLDAPAHWWFGISPQGIGAVGGLLGAAVLATVSLLKPDPKPTQSNSALG